MTLENLMLNDKDEMFSDKKQIFIVDDDESVRRSLKLLMDSYGFAVETFPSAEEYFKVVPNSTKCCLILDVHIEDHYLLQMVTQVFNKIGDKNEKGK
jgi:FixJ family two-component response regulator